MNVQGTIVELYKVTETWRGLGRREGVFMFSDHSVDYSVRSVGLTFLFGEFPNGALEALEAARASGTNEFRNDYNEYDSITVTPLTVDDPLYEELMQSYGVTELTLLAVHRASEYRFDDDDFGVCGPAELESMLRATVRRALKDGSPVALSSGRERREIGLESNNGDEAVSAVLARYFGWHSDINLTAGSVRLRIRRL